MGNSRFPNALHRMVGEKRHVDKVEKEVAKNGALDLAGNQINASVEKAREENKC